MNTVDGFRRPVTELTLDGLDTTTSTIETNALLVSGGNKMLAPLDMGSFSIKNLQGGTGTTDAVAYGQLASYDTVAARTAADTAVTNAYIAADALKLSLTGGVMTGTITSNSTTPFNFENANSPVVCRMSAGNVSVTNACTLQMNSHAASILDFRDNTNTTKAQFKYLNGSPGSLNMVVNAVTALSTTGTLATFGVPVAMSSKNITGLLAGAAASTDAANVSQMEAGDTAVTNAFNSALTSYSTTAQMNTALALKVNTTTLASYSTTAQMNTALALKVDTTTLASYPTTAQMNTADALKLDKAGGTMTGAIVMGGTNKITGLSAGASGTTDACNVSQMQAGDATVVASSLQKVGGSANTMTGPLVMGTQQITQLATATGAGNAVRYDQTMTVDGVHPMAANMNMGSFKIESLAPSTSGTDAVNQTQIQTGAIPRTAWQSGETIQIISRSSRKGDTLNLTTGMTGTTAATSLLVVPYTSKQLGCTTIIQFTVTAYRHSNTASGEDIVRLLPNITSVPGTTEFFHFQLSPGQSSIYNLPYHTLSLQTAMVSTNTSTTMSCGITVLVFTDDTIYFGAPWSLTITEVKA